MATFAELWESLLPIGRDDGTGGYFRQSWTEPELRCRAWFTDQAERRGMAVERDGNGNLFAWWAEGKGQAVLTGSHFDSVPGGGAYDGPLGIVSAFAAVDVLRAEGFRPGHPIGVAAFVEEEGARFGVSCLGSRLLAGEIDPDRAAGLTDAEGTTFAEAVSGDLGPEPPEDYRIGRDDDLLGRIGSFVELHVEQGRALDVPVGVAGAIWPHGRWRMDFAGRGDHAGSTRLEDRHDPMQPFAHAVIAAREAAERHGARATVGRVRALPGGTNVIASQVTAWLDARGPGDEVVRATVAEIRERVSLAAAFHGVDFGLSAESYTSLVDFDADLRKRIVAALGGAPVLPTAAGHDAGILAARLPTAMLFVRNPTGVSHAPEEHATEADCLAGVAALAAVLRDLAAP
ncbi:N-carbamoyl-L-amino-acid hydrolase [Actinocorallia herbida]|uniref:N-carbamoyl-L-amino-acid hydrolase n=1 Tax=Actinocorallia herbida TaxID=58109 RepID=A0A3N1CPL1_9ACTN|nr:allantoate amidohydrolase [Actinocorallia herbida]ROO83257.1 N-carbamoyl-L-amino-acid hydrolase [Actinocorallia herbida]